MPPFSSRKAITDRLKRPLASTVKIVDRFDVDAMSQRQLHRFERLRLALARLGLRPSLTSQASKAKDCHQYSGRFRETRCINAYVRGGNRSNRRIVVGGVVDKQRIGAAGDQQAHHFRLSEPGRVPVV